MKIRISSVMVDDQEKALRFYTQVLGFVKKADVRQGDYRWLTVVSPEAPDGAELLLEPMAFPPARTYQKALYDAGITANMFMVEDVQKEYERLKKLGVVFRGEPTVQPWGAYVVLEDTCGNLINLSQV